MTAFLHGGNVRSGPQRARMSALLPGGRVDETIEPKSADIRYGTDEPVRYEADGPIAWITMNRPGCGNAQNSQMTYALDAALRRAVDDDAIKVIIGGAGRNFSGGHDIGTPGRDVHKSCPPP